MDKFVGRKIELCLINETLNRPSASVLIYGKRKVGKTTLIMKALENLPDKVIYYECLKSTMEDNIRGFVSELVREKIIPVKINFESFLDVFAYLDSLNQTFNIVFDEYPYLKEFTDSREVDSIFQKIIDNNIKHIRLFISGSHIGMMKDMLKEENALYGRFSLTIHLPELNYKEAAEFYSGKSTYDKIAVYCIFGGSPFINSFILPEEDLRTNVINTILNTNSPVYNYAEHLLITDYAKSVNAERIIYTLSNGRKRYGEIESILKMKNNGLLSKQLQSLLEMEIISKHYPINKQDDKKKIAYELSDNLLRFYYAFVFKNKSALLMLGPKVFYDEYIEKSIITFISHRFEELCRSYFSLRIKSGKMRGVTNIGTYYYDDSTTHSNGEFDVVLEHKESYDVYEVKYYKSPMPLSEMKAEVKQIESIKGLNVGNIGFVAASGFETEDAEYLQINGDELYL